MDDDGKDGCRNLSRSRKRWMVMVGLIPTNRCSNAARGCFFFASHKKIHCHRVDSISAEPVSQCLYFSAVLRRTKSCPAPLSFGFTLDLD